MKEIREWLANGQDYALGLALYETHGRSRVVLTALRRGASDFTRQKLRTELEKLVGPTAVPQPAARVANPPKAAPSAQVVVHTPAVDEHVQRQRSGWFAERARLHAQLELVPTDEERRVMAERILELSDLLTASYHPGGPDEAPRPRTNYVGITDKAEIRRLLANLRPQASKLKKKPARALDLQQVQADIKILEKNLLKP